MFSKYVPLAQYEHSSFPYPTFCVGSVHTTQLPLPLGGNSPPGHSHYASLLYTSVSMYEKPLGSGQARQCDWLV